MWLGPTVYFLGAPPPPPTDPRPRKESPSREGAPTSSCLLVPGGSSAPVPAAAGGTICTAQVCPAPCPTWGLRTLGRLWPPRARGQLRPGCHLCARGLGGRGPGRRGGPGDAGTRPRRAPFKRCQGLIDEKWPRAGANLSPEAAGRGPGRGGGGCLVGAQLSRGHYRGGLPRAFQPGGGG